MVQERVTSADVPKQGYSTRLKPTEVHQQRHLLARPAMSMRLGKETGDGLVACLQSAARHAKRPNALTLGMAEMVAKFTPSI